MSLTKLLKAPIKLFRKEVITFVTVRRYDLGLLYENLRYIAVRPSASIFVLRQKVWHLLDLPDYCEEVIILKSPNDVEVPLTELRKGNDPYCPYILEVWLPGNRTAGALHLDRNLIRHDKAKASSIVPNNMLMDKEATHNIHSLSTTEYTEKTNGPDKSTDFGCTPQPTISNETMALDKSRGTLHNILYADKYSELSCRSTSSIFGLHRKKSRTNFANILLKIQNDLCNLTSKLDILENKISS